MSFDLEQLTQAVAEHGRIARVVVASAAGSVPRGPGTAMLVWTDDRTRGGAEDPSGLCGGQSGTIGGGALEHQAVTRARQALTTGDRLDKVPLGPGLGQCCGGAVTLLTEIWDAARLATIDGPVVRALPGFPPAMPLKVANRLGAARTGRRPLTFEQIQGWLIEPLTVPAHDLWIWGAGHVGRAIAAGMAPLPDWRLTWIDTAADRFPDPVPPCIQHIAPQPQFLAPEAPAGAHHLILTYSHAIDLDLCHRLLSQPTGSIGLIGSATKWARFKSRLSALGHSDTHRITCPIGDPALGKHPQAIALGVCAALLRDAPALAGSKAVQA